MTVLEALTDPNLFASHFGGESWASWRVALEAIFGLPLSNPALYRTATGREQPPTEPAREAWIVAGRRGGKSRIAALIAVYLAAFKQYELAAGERAVVMVLAADRRQARVVFRYVAGLLEAPLLRSMVERETAESIDLRNGVSVEVHTASFRSIRGYTVAAAVLDEVAFWRSEESAEPDVEIVNALRPAMASVPGSLLVGISSPYARRGLLYKAHARHFGKDGDPVLCWKAPTLTMNPTIPQHIIDAAYAEDESAARAEWGAEFRADLEALFDLDALRACVVPGRRELPPLSTLRYQAFVDPSGGRGDAFTLAIGHKEGERAVVDVLRAWRPPFNPSGVVEEIAALLADHRVHRVAGDRYAGEWPREAFRSHGITYDVADKAKSELYLALLSTVNSGRIELPEDQRLVTELRSLERRRGASGKDRVDHPPGGHDDRANAVAGLSHLLLGKRRGITFADLYPPRPGDADYVEGVRQ